ncbi:hypothetical protein [Streptomyces sp. TP-A0356]|uniref:hypothetical protein n=1 Tax=Streptomyces sp. TP-A0356 TaxID=1359208 RepID=UPI000A700913|nr:hypothetical protein [Streptomyces sp. TP-A0356]
MNTNDMTTGPRARLTRGQAWILAAATLPMIGGGVAGAVGTYSNITSVFHRSATALGVVAAGEGATLVLALVLVGLTMLGQTAPAPVRLGLWLLPASASITGAIVAPHPTDAVIFAVTPLAMTVSAEGLGLLARRIVVHRTGVDMEAQRRNAETVQRLAYHRARAANHPSKGARWRSERASWRLAKRVGVGDAELGARLVEVQRDRLCDGADAALADMFGVTAGLELPAAGGGEDDRNSEPVTEPAAVEPGEVTVERADDDQPPAVPAALEVVIPPVGELAAVPFRWEDVEGAEWPAKVTTAVAAEVPRQVITETVTLTPVELRRQARRLNRQALAETSRPVTIKTLQDELGLSRREATELRREIVPGVRS